MENIIIALAIGICAGGIDIMPMFGRNIPRTSIFAMFMQWVMLGLIIPFISWDLAPWLIGLILGILGMTPYAIQLWLRNRKAIISTLFFGGILGSAIGVAGSYFIH